MLFWYTGGNTDISGAIEQLEKDSDRAVGLVGAAIVEHWLTQAIQARLHQGDMAERMFRSSGPLGSFSAKIDLAFLMGLIGLEFHGDLVVMKSIRNAFAHKLETATFASKKIRDLCSKFKLVDRMVGEITVETFREAMEAIKENRPMRKKNRGTEFHFTGAREALKDTRKRYILAAQLLSFNLGRIPTSEPPTPKI